MPLTAEEKTKLLEFINSKWVKNIACHRCGSNRWVVDGVVQTYLARTAGKGLALGGPFLPNAVLVCQNCGSTELLNLVVAGIVKAAP